MIAKEENSKGKKLIWVIITTIILALLFFSGFLKDKAQNLFKQTEKSLELVQNINIPWLNDGKTRGYDGIIINSDNENIISYNLLGKQLWSKTVDFDSPITYLGEDIIYTVDKDKGQVIAFNTKGEKTWIYEARQSINKIVEKNNHLIIYTKAGQQIDQINILNEKGSLIANTIIDKGRLLSSNISTDRKKFVLTTIDLSNNELQTSLLLYTIEGELLWKKDFSDWIIFDAVFEDNDTIILLSDNKIMSINTDNEMLWSKDLEGGLKDGDVNSKQKEIYLLYGQEKNYIEILESNGKTKNKVVLDSNYDSIYVNKENIYLTGNDKLVGINGDNIFLSYICDNKIDNIGFIKDDILIITEGKLLVGKLTNKKEDIE